MKATRSNCLAILLAVSATWIASTNTFAATDTWVGNTSTLFSDANWTGGNNPPLSGDSLVFGVAGSSGTSLTADQAAAISYAGITFNSGASAFTIGGANGITLTGNVANNGTSLETLNFPIAATAVRTFTTTAGGGDITLGGNFTGTGGGIIKAGSGTLTLSGANAYTGATTVNASGGTLTLSGTYTGAGALTVNAGATLSGTSSGVNSIGNFLVTGASASATLSSGTYNVTSTSGNSKIDNGGSMTVNGATLNTSGNSSWFSIGDAANTTSTVTLNSGAITLANQWGAVVGRIGTGVLTINGGTFTENASGGQGLIIGGETTAQGGTVNLNGGTLTPRKLSAGNGGGTSYAFNFNGGTLKANTVNAGGSFWASASKLTANVRNNASTIDNNGTSITIGQALVHSTIGGDNATDGGLTFIGSGTTTLSGANSYNGGTTLNTGTGTLTLGNAFALGTGTLTLTSGKLDSSVAGLVNANNNAQNWNADFTFVGSQSLNLGSGNVTLGASRQVTVTAKTLTVGGIISGSGYGLTKLGAGTLVLSGASTYSGATTINAGTVTGVVGGSCANSAVSVAATSGNTATLSVSITDNTKQWTCSGLTVNNSGNGCTLDFNYSVTASTTLAPLSVNGDVTFTTLPTITVAGGGNIPVSSGNGYPLITWTGTGPSSVSGITLTLSPASRVTGNLAIVGNTLYLQITSNKEPLKWAPSTSGTWDTATSNWKDNTATAATYADGDAVVFDDTYITGNTNVTLNSTVNPFSVTFNNSTYAYTNSGSGAIAGSASLTKSGTQSVKLSNANTYTGGTALNAGTLLIGNASALGAGSLTLNGGTVKNQTGGNVTVANNVVVGSGSSTITTGDGANFTLTGVLSGAGNLTIGASGVTASIYPNFSGNTMTSGTITLNGNPGIARLQNPPGISSALVDFVINVSGPGTDVAGTWTFGSFGGSGNFYSIGATTYYIGGANHDATYSGVQSGNTAGSPAIIKVGTGAQTFSGASTHSGPFTVRDGSLIAGAAVAVSANGPFGNSSSAIALGDATTISSATAMNPKLLIGGAFTMARTVTVGANNNALGNGSTTFTLGGNTANSSTFSGAITLNQNLVVTQATGGSLTISGLISDGGNTRSLTKTGNGTLTLSVANTYTGNTTVSAGTLLVNGSTASGSAVSVSGSGSVLGGSGTINGATTISSSGALTPRPSGGSATTTTFGGNLTLSSASANFTVSASGISGNDQVVYGSSATLTLDNTDTINITGATLDTANDYTLFTSSGGTVSMTTTPTLKVNGVTSDQTSAGSYQLVVAGSLLKLHYIQAALPPTVNSQSASPASLGHYQTTTVTVNVTPQPGKTISSVTVTLDQLGGAGDPTTLTGPGGDGTGPWTGTFAVPPTLVAGSYTISGSVNQSDATTAGWSVTGITVTNSSPIWGGSGADNIWSTGGNWDIGRGPGSGDSVAFAGATQLTNNLDASVTIASLTFNSGAGSFDITNSASTLTLTGGLTNNSVYVQTLDVPVALSGSQTISATGNVTINGAVSGAGFTLAGGGTLTLSGVNTYSGATTVGNGLLTIGGAGQLGSGTYSAVITNNGALNYGSSASQTLSGIISGTGTVTNSGSGTLTLNGANTFSGGVTLNSGTLIYGNASALGSGTATLAGGTLRSGNVNIANNISVSGSTILDLAGGLGGGNSTWSGNISGSAALTLNNSGSAATLSLSGTNSGYGGTIAFNNNNAVDFKSANAGSANAAWVFNDGNAGRVRMSFGNGTINFGSLAGSGQLVNNTASSTTILSVGALNTSTTFGGTIKDATGILALTKVGTGTMTLSGANTYTGNTVVSNGTLLVNSPGSLGNTAVAVKTGATLGGNGTLGGAVTVEAGGMLAPGASIGTLSLGSLTLDSGSTTAIELGDSLSGDKAAATGAVVYGGTLKLLWTGTTSTTGPVDLFDGSSFSGGFSSLQLSNWPSAYRVSTNSLTTDGSITIAANAAPVANNLTLGVARGATATLQVIGGKHTPADADGDSVAVMAVSAPIIGGGLAATNGGTGITYTANATSVLGTNTFTYTVTDPFGATDTKTVTVVVSDPQGFNQLASPVDLGGGTVALSYLGIPGVNYALDWATNLTPPINWTGVLTNTAGANGTLNFTNTSGEPLNFYRTRYVSGP